MLREERYRDLRYTFHKKRKKKSSQRVYYSIQLAKWHGSLRLAFTSCP